MAYTPQLATSIYAPVDHVYISASQPRIWQPFPNYTKVWTAPAEPLGLAPTDSWRAGLPLPCSAPRPSLPPSSWPVTIQPFGNKEVHRFTGSHNPGMRLVLSMAESMAKQRTVLNRHRRGHQPSRAPTLTPSHHTSPFPARSQVISIIFILPSSILYPKLAYPTSDSNSLADLFGN